MQTSKRRIARIILAILVVFAVASTMSTVVLATEDTPSVGVSVSVGAEAPDETVIDEELITEEKAEILSEETTVEEGDTITTGAVEESAEAEESTEESAETEESTEETEEEENKFANTIWALLPPVIAIGLALITKEVYSSLLIGIITGALLSSSFNFTKAVDNLVNEGFIGAVSGTAGIFIFLVLLGIIVALVNKCGASYAFGQWAQKHVKSRVGVALATSFLGMLIFIDDYFNCLTVGSVMRPVTDAKGISRAKLAFIIDATAAPVCMIAPVSSWAAAVSEFAEGTGLNGYELFIKAIPFNFYSLLTLAFVILNIVLKADFGPMKLHEMNAMKGDLYTTGDKVDNVDDAVNPKGKLLDLIFPVVVLIVCSVIGLLYVGGYGTGISIQDAFADTDATVGLPLGAFVAIVIIFVYLIARRVVSFKEAMSCVPSGFIAMVPAILILTFATALKNMTGLLGADVYVHDIMEGAASGLQNFLPAIIFLVACFLAFSTGTSWGTFGILIPIVASIFEPTDELLYIGMSACLAGAVCGDHCSPISDTTIMASAGAQCNHINHVSTQLPYAIFVAVLSFIGFIIAGFVQNAFIVLAILLALLVASLLIIRKIGNKTKA